MIILYNTDMNEQFNIERKRNTNLTYNCMLVTFLIFHKCHEVYDDLTTMISRYLMNQLTGEMTQVDTDNNGKLRNTHNA